ncbi:hypothetical protein SOVF_012770 [Spinacia oleracea]|nr:hypothetical protein SOVF_012770 [Spinacia oleracea]
MFEVGALLLVAGEKLMPLCISEGEDYMVFNNFKEIGHFLQAKNTWSAMSNAELTEKKGILSLLDIFAKIGNQLNAYVRIKEKRNPLYKFSDVVTLLEDAGFDVECKDLHLDDPFYRY